MPEVTHDPTTARPEWTPAHGGATMFPIGSAGSMFGAIYSDESRQRQPDLPRLDDPPIGEPSGLVDVR
jgi:hypothetical protein